jgi:hypothetical protein
LVSVKIIIFILVGIGIASAVGFSSFVYVGTSPKISSPPIINETLPVSQNLTEVETPVIGKLENPSIAYVRPLFTDVAYSDAFYNFYKKYSQVTVGEQVTQDLDLLTPHVDNGGIKRATVKFLDHLRTLDNNNTNVTVLTDLDLDTYDGNILLKGNGGEKYDAVLLGHQEYVTQKEYEVLKEYVAGGGTLVILDANVFYAEVKYDKDANTIQLVKGHSWEFDGTSARKSIGERWAEETSQWMGSNYLCSDCKITFDSNPFEYRHYEEQYITNPDADIIFDYGAKFGDHGLDGKVIATYHMNYEKGKVIVMGIYGERVVGKDDFLKFFDDLLEKYAGIPQ